MIKNILIPDGNSTWALSVARCLDDKTKFKLFILSTKKRTSTKFSKYTHYYKFFQPADDAEWLKILNHEIENNAIDVVVPIAEEEIYFFIKNSEKISKMTSVIPLPSLSAFETAIDKNDLGNFCKTNQIPYPKSVLIKELVELNSPSKAVNFPVLLKPLHDKGGNGIIKFTSLIKLQDHIDNNPNDAGFFIQEFIEGFDIDCSVLCLDGKILTHTIQKGFLPGDSPYAPQLGLEFLKNTEVLSITRELMKALKWSGIAHLDLRFDKNTASYKVIEINARFWGSVEASRSANINFPELVCDLALGKNIEGKPYNFVKYIRLKGVFKYIKHKPSRIFSFNKIMNNTETSAVLRDPFPTIYKFKEWLGRQFS